MKKEKFLKKATERASRSGYGQRLALIFAVQSCKRGSEEEKKAYYV
jgi:hypothetical protein